MNANNDILAEYGESAVAVIGMEIRFPGADNMDAFWDNLSNGVESIHRFSKDELKEARIDESLINDPNFVPCTAAIKDPENFDAHFFGFSPREAELLDPQQRLFLECSWAALEVSGYDAHQYSGSIGVFAGSGRNHYAINHLYPNGELVRSTGDYALMLGNDKDFLATRTAFKLNLKGPAISIQTACSTGLVAVHGAIQSLLNGECDIALAGAVTLKLPQEGGHIYEPGGIGSPDGHCRAFDKDAKGTVGGSGVAVVVLKRLSEAINDGDLIQAVIRGSAINNDGSLKAGYTAPSIDGQAAVIREAFAVADVPSDSISYIETHGTGTLLGDPIEITALNKVFSENRSSKNQIAIGSVKTNIGHLDTASGLAGLVKTILSLKNKQIAPSLHYKTPNPNIDFDNSPFYVNTRLKAWDTEHGAPRIASVSSFGIGGTNAHIVVQEAPCRPTRNPANRQSQLLVLSAKTEAALNAAKIRLRNHLQSHPEQDLCDIAYTLQLGRRPFQYRSAFICGSHEEGIEILSAHGNPKTMLSSRIGSQNTTRNCFYMFPGQGSQYPGMGSDIYHSEQTFRDAIDQGCDFFKQITSEDLFSIIYPEDANCALAIEKLKQTRYAQPALFIFEYALAQLWLHWGVAPNAMVGHSLGEYVAACLAGVFSYEDGIRIVTKRGNLIQSLPAGGMIAVRTSERNIQKFLSRDLSLAAVNAPEICTVSGTFEAIDEVQELLDQAEISYQPLETSHAFHSAMLDPILDEFTAFVKSIALSDTTLPYVSSLTGDWITSEQATSPQYWTQQLSKPVRFSESIRTLLNENNPLFLEVGPARVLSGLISRNVEPSNNPDKPTALHSLDKPSNFSSLQNALAQLWLNHIPVDWNHYYDSETHARVPLPSYPFESTRYWIEPISKSESSEKVPSKSCAQSDAKKRIDHWFYTLTWQRSFANHIKLSDPLSGACLLFKDNEKIGDSITRHLSISSHPIISIYPADEYQQLDEKTFTLNPSQPEHYRQLIDQIRAQKIKPSTVIHLWNFEKTDNSEPKLDIRIKGIHSIASLAKALDEFSLMNGLDFYFVSNNAYDVTGQESLSSDKAALRGPLIAIPQEYPSCKCRHIDFPNDMSPDTIAGKVIGEMIRSDGHSTVAYRGTHRWVPLHQPISLDHASSANDSQSLIRSEGSYLIVGGLGGIGLSIAEYLAREFQAKIVLTSRNAFPAKSTWNQPHPGPIADRIEKLQAIEALGAELHVVQADLSQPEQLRSAISNARNVLGSIHGIIHAAGSLPNGLITEKTFESIETQLAPKNQALSQIHTSLTETPLDFIVLMSSLSSWLGGLGGLDYAASNAALDTHAHKLSKIGIHTILINWDGWSDVGMAEQHFQSEDIAQEKLASLKSMAIKPSEGVDLFARIMRSRYPHVLISTSDLTSRMADLSKSPGDSSSPVAPTNQKQYQRPSIDSKYVPPRTATERRIVEIWQSILGIDLAGIRDNYFDLGGDSLLLLRVQKEIQNSIDPSITKTDLFEFPTIEALAEFIDNKAAPSSNQITDKTLNHRQRDALINNDQSDRLERRRQRKLN